MTTIGEHVLQVSTWNPSREPPDTAFTYIDLSAVSNETKCIVAPVEILCGQAPTRARQLIRRGDVLVSTVRPNLNAVALVGQRHDGATASTGFTVLRPAPSLDSNYLYHWVRSRGFIESMTRSATGASYPAVSDRIVKDSLIPLPPIEEQRRIAAILDRASRLLELIEGPRTHLQELNSALLHQALSTVDSPPRTLREWGWDFSAGRNLVATKAEHPKNRVIKVSAISSGRFEPTESKPLPLVYEPPIAHAITAGDILFGRASGSLHLLGATALAGHCEDLYLPDKVWRLELGSATQTLPRFALAILQSDAFLSHIRHNASGAAGVRNVSRSAVLSFSLPMPSRAVQDRFVRSVATADRIHDRLNQQADSARFLFCALQARAFSGTL